MINLVQQKDFHFLDYLTILQRFYFKDSHSSFDALVI